MGNHGEDMTGLDYLRGVFESIDFKVHCMKEPSSINIEDLIINAADNLSFINNIQA